MGNDVGDGFPMVENLIVEMLDDSNWTTDQVIKFIHVSYQKLGPYEFCKVTRQLVNNSAEEFAMQWMQFFNKYIGYSFY